MKRIAVAAMLIVCMAAAISCQTKTIVGATMIVQWDAPALGIIPAVEVGYEVWLQPYPSGTSVLVATIVTFEQVVTFTLEGAYKIGVRMKRTVVADGTVIYSPYNWSDIDGSPSPWYVVFYLSPPKVLRVRIK